MDNSTVFKPRLEVLNGRQIRDLHLATATLLERTGVKVTHPRALEVFAGGGARVDRDRVRIPRDVLEKAIEKAPSRIVLENRNGEAAVVPGYHRFSRPRRSLPDARSYHEALPGGLVLGAF